MLRTSTARMSTCLTALLGRQTFRAGFADPNLSAGFAAFDIKNINGLRYVTHAKQDADKNDDAADPGNGPAEWWRTTACSGTFSKCRSRSRF
jgi:hypothetical protein